MAIEASGALRRLRRLGMLRDPRIVGKDVALILIWPEEGRRAGVLGPRGVVLGRFASSSLFGSVRVRVLGLWDLI